jgi:hypothetical protein
MNLTRDARVICLLALLPGLYWIGGPETAPALKRAGIEQFSAPPARLSVWKQQAGYTVTPLGDEAIRGRVKLTAPGIDRKVMVASATSAPWVNANGWEIRRNPGREFYYELPANTAPLAAAEAFAYGAKAVLKIDPADLDGFGKMLQFLRSIPDRDLPDVADFGFIDNGTDMAGESLNLLTRRNLLYRIVKAPDPRLKLNIPANDDDPHLFAAKVREKLTDAQRSLRVYGSEVVLARLTADQTQARLHLLNYSRRETEGIRLRIRGTYAGAKIYSEGPPQTAADFAAADGFTEFSIPRMGIYAVIDLTR